ncbi:beta-2 adrenergic receptor-like [Diadema antillarum]|uniref:beta-2 adrenergic receptor-like n=1 Tax=Diadema antillarum TaxID=105358 RepID=UPI003A896A54
MAQMHEPRVWNSTDDPMDDFPLEGYDRVTALIASIVGVVLSTVLNLLNLIILPRIPNRFGENGRLCLHCLAVVDIFGGLACFGSRVVFEIERAFLTSNSIVCNAVGASCTVFVSQSTWILFVISVDRYIAVTRPMHYVSILTSRRMKVLIVTAMLMGLTLALTRTTHMAVNGSCDFDHGATHYVNNPAITLYSAIVLFFGSIATALNVRILHIAHRHRNWIADYASKQQHRPRHDAATSPKPGKISGSKYRGVITVAILVGAFYLVWTPHTVGTIAAAATGRTIPEAAYFTIVWIAFSNHWFNAIIYFFFNKAYRTAVVNLAKRRRNPFSQIQETVFTVDSSVPKQLPQIE